MSLPETMTAIAIDPPGGPEALVPWEIPVPAPQTGEVLIKVAAAGVNRPDILQRLGNYPPPPGAPDTPGLEVAGTVVATGPGATRYSVGDRVCALVPGGGYAEYCVAPEPQTLPVPGDMDMEAAAGIPETFFTVWTNVFQRARLVPGETLLVHGGASGIGTTAVMLASALGACVFATAGTANKCAKVQELGAKRAINYREEDFKAVITELTGKRGVDVILDMVGGDYMAKNIACLALEGRLVNVAYLNGSKIELNFLPVMLKRLTIMGSTLRPRSVEQKAVIAEELEECVWPLLSSGRIKPLVDATFPLTDAAGAHRHLEAGEHVGKVILTCN